MRFNGASTHFEGRTRFESSVFWAYCSILACRYLPALVCILISAKVCWYNFLLGCPATKPCVFQQNGPFWQFGGSSNIRNSCTQFVPPLGTEENIFFKMCFFCFTLPHSFLPMTTDTMLRNKYFMKIYIKIWINEHLQPNFREGNTREIHENPGTIQ